jgi:hypothetical protein
VTYALAVRYGALVLGALLVAVGAVWILQGIGTLKGSFMTGQPFWAWTGAACVLFGVPVAHWGWRRLRGSRP